MKAMHLVSFVLLLLTISTTFAQDRVSENYDSSVPPDPIVYGDQSITHFGVLSQESFELTDFPPAGWKKVTNLGGTGWQRATIEARVPGFSRTSEVDTPAGGDSAVAVVSWSTGDADKDLNTPQATDQWLITPQITGVDTSDILVFYLRHFDEFTDTLDVLISTAGDTIPDFTTTVDVLAFSGSGNNAWTRYEYRLSNFVSPGSNVYIAFHEHVANTFEQGDALLLDLVEVSALVTSVRSRNEIPAGIVLHQNYPNPFNPETNISFSLTYDSRIMLRIFNFAGQVVSRPINGELFPAGEHSITFSAVELPSGVYYYTLEAGRTSFTKTMTLVK